MNRALISLTFDDGLPCQWAFAVPEMETKGMRGTFFIPTLAPEYPVDWYMWRLIGSQGHEIGSHSVTHRKAAALDKIMAREEAKQSHKGIVDNIGIAPTSYCYPYTDAPEHVRGPVTRYYLQARAGRSAGNHFLIPGDGANLYAVPSLHVNGQAIERGDIQKEIMEAVNRRAWLTLMFHGIGQDGTWDNVPMTEFTRILKCIRDSGAAVVTFAEGADIYRRLSK